MAVDPAFVVIGGGLMDPEATTEPFRERYLRIVREAADPYLWPAQRERLSVVPAALGDRRKPSAPASSRSTRAARSAGPSRFRGHSVA